MTVEELKLQIIVGSLDPLQITQADVDAIDDINLLSALTHYILCHPGYSLSNLPYIELFFMVMRRQLAVTVGGIKNLESFEDIMKNLETYKLGSKK
jgi:hypothetical protein